MKKLISIAAIGLGISAFGQTQIIAHRGYWKTEPKTAQNSIQSLKNAQQLKVYGSEFDVRMTKDGILVINHDEDLNTLHIAETDLKKLRKQKLSNGEKISTLREYLKAGKKDRSVRLIMELKPLKSEDLENEMTEKALKMVKEFGLEDQVDYISFSLHICKTVKKLNPAAKVQYLKGEIPPAEIKKLGIDGIDYHYSIFLDKEKTWLSEAKALGLITNAWTVNDPEIFQKLKELGIGFVTTDIPEQLIKE